MATAYIALGANLGERARALSSAVDHLSRAAGHHLSGCAPTFETAAVGPVQPAYLNTALKLDTPLSPRALLTLLLEIERAHGRVRDERWGPRTLDLDILLYAELTVNEPALTIPHPRLGERGFVLAPLVMLAPDLGVPGLGRTVRELWNHWLSIDGRGIEVYRGQDAPASFGCALECASERVLEALPPRDVKPGVGP